MTRDELEKKLLWFENALNHMGNCCCRSPLCEDCVRETETRNAFPELITMLRECLRVIDAKNEVIHSFLMDPRLSDANRLYDIGCKGHNLTPSFLSDSRGEVK